LEQVQSQHEAKMEEMARERNGLMERLGMLSKLDQTKDDIQDAERVSSCRHSVQLDEFNVFTSTAKSGGATGH
jgi:hypothetical protein